MSNSLDRAVEFCNNYKNEVANKIMAAINAQSKSIIQDAASRFIPELQETLALKFRQIVSEYYAAYNPEYYVRRHSMYNILKFDTDISTATISWDFDPSEMPYSHGGGGTHDGGDTLFEKAFVGGWHGGAMSISDQKEDKYGAHPSPGTPYYRTGVHYSKWGYRAAKSESPLDTFNEYWATNKKIFEEMFQRHVQSAFDEKIPGIVRSLSL